MTFLANADPKPWDQSTDDDQSQPIENYLCGFSIGLFYDCPTVKTQHD